MILKDTNTYTLRAKTGWGVQDHMDIGWFVGYVEASGNTYFFANCIQSTDTNNINNFLRARIEITFLILDELGIIQKQ
jgi:beta-lactamase class D